MIDSDQHLGSKVRGAFPGRREERWIDEGACPFGDRLPHLRPYLVGRLGANQWSEGRCRIGRISQSVLPGQLDEGLEETVVEILMDIDALDRAAGLA